MSSRLKVLVTGGTGFIGRHIVRELVAQKHSVISVSRLNGTAEVGSSPKLINIVDPSSASRMFADVIVHCAAYVGNDSATADALNVRGTQNVVKAAKGCGARMISVGTMSVYGSGPHTGSGVGELPISPESVASSTRAISDDMVLQGGGIVLRTGLTYGIGDRWLVPSLQRVIDVIGITEEFRKVRTSIISAQAIAIAVTGLVNQSVQNINQIFHLAHPEPANLVTLAERAVGITARSVSAHSFNVGSARLGLSSHQLNLLTRDHWYRSNEIWDAVRLDPGLAIDTPRTQVDWYRRQLNL